MPRARKNNPEGEDEKLFLEFFDMIARRGYDGVRLVDLARALKMKLPSLLRAYGDREDILVRFSKHLDIKVAEGADELDDATPLKEKLFETFMRRMEAMQPFRKGIVRLMDDAPRDPRQMFMLGVNLAPPLCRSLGRMMEFSGFRVDSVATLPVFVGLKLAYLVTLRAWKNDKSHDLTATMAALDRSLDRALKFSQIFP